MCTDGHSDQVDQPARARPERKQSHAHGQTDHAAQKPVAQLHQVLHKRLFGTGELVGGVFGI